jgi:hypothetical protein
VCCAHFTVRSEINPKHIPYLVFRGFPIFTLEAALLDELADGFVNLLIAREDLLWQIFSEVFFKDREFWGPVLLVFEGTFPLILVLGEWDPAHCKFFQDFICLRFSCSVFCADVDIQEVVTFP